MNNSEKISALYFRDFRLFWFGQLISLSGTWMQAVAQGWLVYTLTKSPLYLGIAATASSLPILFFSLIGGIVADRFRKRNLIILTQALSIIPALALGMLTDLHIVTVYEVILLAFFLGVVNAFDMPARQSFLVEMVGKGNLLNAIALNSAAFNGARLIGPVIAGFVIANMSLPACFYLNALSFVAVIIGLSMIKTKGEIKTHSSGFFKDMMEGVHFIRKEKDVLYLMMLIASLSLFGIPFTSFLPVFAEDIFGAGAKGFGLLVSATGLGALTAGVMIAVRGDIRNKMRYMSIAALCFSVSLLFVSVSKVFSITLILLVCAGWGIVSFLATANSFIQLSSTDNLRGRLMSIYAIVFLGFTPIGSFMIGALSDSIGTTLAITFSSIVCLTASGLFLVRYLKTKKTDGILLINETDEY
ncbi:MAG: MFS transporter [Nitrospiraceae bacterium]|nr:MFS transporter [Nitrospiraceae bacterium]